MSTVVKFLEKVAAGSPHTRPCTVLGKRINLEKVNYDTVAPYFGDKVNKEVKNVVLCEQYRMHWYRT